MPVIASDAPIIVERVHEHGPPLVLRVNRYGPDGFGETEIISCADERLQSKYPSLNGAAGRACQQLYGTTFGLNDSFKVYVAATNPADKSLLDELARAPEAELKQLCSRADIAGLRLTQLGPGQRTHATELPVRRLLPLGLDSTPTEQIGLADDGQMEKRPVKYTHPLRLYLSKAGLPCQHALPCASTLTTGSRCYTVVPFHAVTTR